MRNRQQHEQVRRSLIVAVLLALLSTTLLMSSANAAAGPSFKITISMDRTTCMVYSTLTWKNVTPSTENTATLQFVRWPLGTGGGFGSTAALLDTANGSVSTSYQGEPDTKYKAAGWVYGVSSEYKYSHPVTTPGSCGG